MCMLSQLSGGMSFCHRDGGEQLSCSRNSNRKAKTMTLGEIAPAFSRGQAGQQRNTLPFTKLELAARQLYIPTCCSQYFYFLLSFKVLL